MGFLMSGNHYCFLNDDKSVDFNAGMAFIYETKRPGFRNVEKWGAPIRIRCEGHPSDEDLGTLNQIIKDFNRIEGFPGMEIADADANDADENVLLIFAPKEALPEIQQQYHLSEIHKGICQRFSERGEIKRAIVVIESDLDQDYKNSVLLHEMFHMVGFYGHVNDDTSILNKSEIPILSLSGTDTLALRMLYNPEILIWMKDDEMAEYYRN